ncbi:MAG: hypothetical protein IKL21_00720 [Clostridia bacterium]|nr:hypothetical protein [Clostridia bacterium]
MKKTRRSLLRTVSFLTALLMAVSTFACGNGDADTTSSEPPVNEAGASLSLTKTDAGEQYNIKNVTYELNTKTIADGTFLYSEGSPVRKGSGITLSDDKLSLLQLSKLFTEDEKTVVKTKLQNKTPDRLAPHASLFIGLRLTDPGRGPTGNSGVWFAIRGNQVGLRIGDWQTSGGHFVDSPVDFSKKRTLYIEDDHKENVITLFADDDSGKKTEIFRIVISEDKLRAYLPSNPGVPALANKLSEAPPATGYIGFFSHYSEHPVIFEDFTVTGSTKEYLGSTFADPLFITDVFSDTWVATDDEGRTSLQHTDKAIDYKQVGMFYFINSSGSGKYVNHTELYYGDDNGAGGVKRLENIIANNDAHFWAEPYFGYYETIDEWIIRKHVHMLNDAGIDFIFFDITNGLSLKRSYEKVLDTFSEMREEGCKVPKVVFHCGTIPDNVSKTLPEIYSNVYSKDRYKDLWFMWEGKPLVFADDATVAKMTNDIKSKFTFRDSWAHTKGEWYTDTNGKGCWPWADYFPQAAGYSTTGKLEQMVVMSGYWANGEQGRSYSAGRQPKNSQFSFELTTNGTSGKGLAYQEQFDRAHDTNPTVLMLIGWNEWSAGRHSTDQLKNDGQLIAGTYKVNSKDPVKKYSYIDLFSPEYSRDIEPVKGIYKDNYYYQTVANVRKFTGTRAIPAAFGQKTIDMTAGAVQWYSVGPEYRDYQGDTFHRDCDGSVVDSWYKNETGRNDFVVSKVSADADNVYFYAECANDITSAEGTNWMNLFIDSDCNASTGWYGYDYVINRSQNGGKASVEKLATTEKNAEWSLSSAGEAEFKVDGKTIVIKVAKSTVALGNTFDFKWADNSVSDGKEIMQFLDLGDAAPNGRFNYRYTTESVTAPVPAALASGMTVLKANSYNAYVGGEQVMISTSSTKATAIGEQGKIYVPESFATAKLGLASDKLTAVGEHYGIKYVMINDAVTASGKVITVSDNGLIVIADSEITDMSVLDVLYKALM